MRSLMDLLEENKEQAGSKLDLLIAELCPDGVEYKKLGEIGTDFYRGSGITREQVQSSGTPCVRYGEIYTTYGVWFVSAQGVVATSSDFR